MGCPYLEYRESGPEQTFDESRAYCTVVERFVQPMRADICNDRYSFDHRSDCEIYLDATVEEESVPSPSEDRES